MNKGWTAEPWELSRSFIGHTALLKAVTIVGGGHFICKVTRRVTVEEAEATAARIVACVNGCAGMNPEAIPDLIAACEHAGASYHHPACEHRKNPMRCSCHVGKAQDAIAKARKK